MGILQSESSYRVEGVGGVGEALGPEILFETANKIVTLLLACKIDGHAALVICVAGGLGTKFTAT